MLLMDRLAGGNKMLKPPHLFTQNSIILFVVIAPELVNKITF